MHRDVEIDGITLHLSQPHDFDSPWIGQGEILKQLLACWLVVGEKDLPLTPRLVGTPGIGKTALAMAGAKRLKRELYIYQCTADTRPEDLLVTPVLAESGKIAYHASPLVTAMLKGGVCILLDEGNRMNEKSWASLAPLFDHRRYVESIVAGITITAHPDFRAAVTMNQDESTYEIPDYILSRLQPTLTLGFPDKQDEMAILQYHLPFAEPQMLAVTVELQHAHQLKLDFSPRDGMSILRYAMKRLAQDPQHPLSKDVAWREAIEKCLGADALDIEAAAKRRARTLGGDSVPLGLGDFFFDPDDPLHPDRDEEEE